MTPELEEVASRKPATYQKRPINITALRWNGDLQSALEFIDAPFSVDDTTSSLYIETLEGEMEGRIGDWIIKGVAGEFYPCKPEVFAESYQRVCRTCGCTDDNACSPSCHWVELDLCSACAPRPS